MNEARFSSIHRGLSSVAQKVYAAVPIADEWAIEAVRRELTRKGHTIDLHTIRGWGHDLPGAQLRVAAERPGANLNTLLDENLRDPLSGNAVLGGVAVEMCAVG